MSGSHPNNFPKLHNAAWPGVVGKGEGSEPPIDLDTMLDLTAAAEVDGVKFDGVRPVPLRCRTSTSTPPTTSSRRWPTRSSSRGLAIGSVVAPVWPPTGGGSAMDEGEGRKKFLEQVHKGCRIARRLRELGVRPYGVVRIDSACGAGDWADDPEGNQKKIAETFKQAARDRPGPRRAARRRGRDLLGRHALLADDGRPARAGRRARDASASRPTWPTRSSTPWARTPPRTASCPQDFDWKDQATLDAALKTLTDALRPWTIDFHVAQNDATVFGSGSHDHTGRHCLATDPNGKLDIPHHAGFWLRDEHGQAHQEVPAHLLGRLHVPQRRDDEAADLERHPRRDDRRPRRPRLDTSERSRRSHDDTVRRVGHHPRHLRIRFLHFTGGPWQRRNP